MALSTEERRQLLALELPSYNATLRRVRDYMARTQLNPADIAVRIGYAHSSIRHWLNGTYQHIASNDTALRANITRFMDAHPAGSDDDADDDAPLYDTENTRMLRKYFQSALNQARAYYVHGDPGSQKTFVGTRLVHELNRSELRKEGTPRRGYYVYCRDGLRPHQLMKRIAESCGVISSGDIDRIIRNIRFEFRGQRVVLVIDEAQHLDVHCLEVVRELFDRPPHFGLLLMGSHELERTFVRDALKLEQLMSRFHAGKALPGMTDDEALKIVQDQLGSVLAKEKMLKLVDRSRTKTLRQGGTHTYISARRLFWNIREIKQAFTAQKGGEA